MKSTLKLFEIRSENSRGLRGRSPSEHGRPAGDPSLSFSFSRGPPCTCSVEDSACRYAAGGSTLGSTAVTPAAAAAAAACEKGESQREKEKSEKGGHHDTFQPGR